MQLDLKKLPFGQTVSRHLLFEEWDPMGKGYEKGCWLALASESSSMFGGVVERAAGTIRVQPTLDGVPAEFTAEATPALAVLKGEGGRVRFAIDKTALLVEGDGFGLSLTVKLGHGETVTKTDDGCILNMGATRYIIEMKKGSLSVDVSWDLIGLHSNDPVLTLTPADGKLEAIFWDCDLTYTKYPVAESVDAAAKEAEEAFHAFKAAVRGTNEIYAYALWLGYMPMKGQSLVVGNKIGNVKAEMRDQNLAALAFKDAEKVFDLVLSQLRLMTKGGMVPALVKTGSVVPEACVPLWGLVMLRNPDWSKIPAEKAEETYCLLTKAIGWWEKNRSKDGEFFYAYAHESGWAHNALLPDASPVVTPDLAGWMAANYKALSKLAALLGKDETAAYAEKSEKQVEVLKSLWTGENYFCRSALDSSVKAPCTAALGLLTGILGDLLPKDIAAKLDAWQIAGFGKLMTGLLALQCAKKSAALVAAGAEKPVAGSAAFYDPTFCAILLALEERS